MSASTTRWTTSTHLSPGAPLAAPALSDAVASLLGPRLRAIRLERGWTLEVASQAIGLSRSAISKIERGDVTPSFDALLKLSKGLALDVSELLADASSGQRLGVRPVSGRRCIMRLGTGINHEMQHYAVRMLAPEIRNPAFIPYEFTAKCESPDQFADWDRHDSEDLIYVLCGTMELHCEQYEPVRLEAGESIYFDARMGHAIVAVGTQVARGLCVSVPV